VKGRLISIGIMFFLTMRFTNPT